MKLQILVSTMHQNDYSLINRMRISTDAIIINQCDNTNINNLKINCNEIIWVNTVERGLSKSRNCALLNADADVCIIADDDLIYNDNYHHIVLQEFKEDPTVDIIAFQVKGIEREFKKYSSKKQKINILNSMKISSVEIAFRLKKINDKGIKFNELFGSGAKYYMGEESIFLTECLKKGLKIKYSPKCIANLHIGESTWFQGYNEKYFINKGAAFTAMSRSLSFLLIVQFAIRKKELYYESFNVISAIKLMLKGRKNYLTDLVHQ